MFTHAVCMFMCCVFNVPWSWESIYCFKSLPWRAAVRADSISIELKHRLSLLCLANTLRAHVSLTSSTAQSSFLCYTVITPRWHLGLLKVGIQRRVCMSICVTVNETAFYRRIRGAFIDDSFVTDLISGGRCSIYHVDNTNTDQHRFKLVVSPCDTHSVRRC